MISSILKVTLNHLEQLANSAFMKSTTPSFCFLIKGGLGNQLFIYAAGLGLSKKFNASLLYAVKAGFLIDRRYRRKLEISELIKRCKVSNADEIVWLILLCFAKIIRVFQREKSFVNLKFLGIGLIQELNHDSSILIDAIREFSGKKLYIDSYCQDSSLFDPAEVDICRSIIEGIKCLPNNKNYEKLKNQIIKDKPISIGLRFYEETSDPDAYSYGKKWTIDSIVKTIKEIKNYNTYKIYVFSTVTSVRLEELESICDITYCTPDNGIADAKTVIELMSLSDIRVITNSTLYWWGAYLSNSGVTYISSDILNQRLIDKRWNSF